MSNSTSTAHDHSHHHDGVAPASAAGHEHHHHAPDGTHVMPDGAVMTGAHHDHAAHAHAHRGGGAHPPKSQLMLTGGGKTTAEADGREVGIDEVMAEVFPEDKAAVVKRLQAEGRIVAMAGDGVNDAPALAQATVGVTMGTGMDVAMEGAGITLLKGDLMGSVRARTLSRATTRNMRQNLLLSFACNVAGIPLAAGVLYPFFGLLLSPVVAAAAMALSSVSVIGNALRLHTVRVD